MAAQVIPHEEFERRRAQRRHEEHQRQILAWWALWLEPARMTAKFWSDVTDPQNWRLR